MEASFRQQDCDDGRQIDN